MKSSNLVFGFDLGTNSIGWAVTEETAESIPQALVGIGSRIFLKAVEDKTPTPKNLKRRTARLARRVIQRRARRRAHLQNFLISLGLLPETVKDASQREAVLNALGDPYALRAKALDAPLTHHELGRAIVHVGIRRGFQSNRKTLLSDMADDPDVLEMLTEIEQESADGKSEADNLRIQEESAFKAAISTLQAEIDASGSRTLGEFLSRQPSTVRKRNRRIGREMLRHELACILGAQRHVCLTEAVKQEIAHIIFHQRPLRWDSSTIGNCSLETNRRRAAIARLEFQHFRMLQDINHIHYDYPQINQETGEIKGLGLTLTADDRKKLIAKLDGQRTITWAAIKKEIGLPKTVHFNLEEGTKKGLGGNSTACSIRRVIGDSAWESMHESKRYELVEDLLKFEKKSALKTRLINHWGFDVRTAIGLATLELESGHGNLSLKAIRRILPFLEDGMIYSDARQAAGYSYEAEVVNTVDRLPSPRDLRNPVANKALHEFRRVCNALIAQYGKPSAIRIELPRELTMNKKRKAAFEKQQKDNQKANDQAREQYSIVRLANQQLALPEYAKRNDLIKYRLWKEQGGLSMYSGRAISLTELFSAAVEVDHILPYSRTLDDSYMNKVVAFATENRDKGNRTPYEAYSGSGDAWEQLVQRARKAPLTKRNRILREKLDGLEDFVNSQLADTAYISREVKDYVRVLGADVSVSKGQLTSWLRHRWGLNSLLGGEQKNREDHRHHAIDAAVTASVSRRLYAQIVRIAEKDPLGGSPDVIRIDPPFADFRSALESELGKIIVSHDAARKLSGAFHEETGYGAQKTRDGDRIVYRKPLNQQFDEKQIAKVADPTLKKLLAEHLARFGGDPKVAFSDDNRPRLSPNKAQVRHVRVVASESFNPDSFLQIRVNGKTVRLHPFGNNHHVEILRDTKNGKFRGVFVNTWQAAQRIRRDKRSPILTEHGDDAEFVMALHINDLVTAKKHGVLGIYRVQKLDPANNRIVLRAHTAATLDNIAEEFISTIPKLMSDAEMTLIRLNVLGHPLNDQANS
ncbi:type II CRISPR RNA-guided endonuclease Cas9 [Rhodocyclus tenuis]|uniref:type II CRISPR RNA-guided endonuclease Cas9 n=1 Tax=Rhodocyclus tenuis TaxID=1066 RepID=UPI001905AFDB|nr:type II CRISPR RNA-guided endonuclease Cas9 [Rhodocyclus tenuis]